MSGIQSENLPSSGRAGDPVLLVDDDGQGLVILAMIVERLGYQVHTAIGPEKAIDAALLRAPAAVVTEMNLRGMTGLALMHRIREEVRRPDLPAIIMTRQLSPEFSQHCRRAGAAGSLRKPVQADELYCAINHVVEPRSRRADFRLPTSLPASINGRPLAEEGERVTNLSVNGLYLRATTIFPVDMFVRIDLVLHGETVTAEARVVYSRPSGQGPGGMGLQFLTLSPQGREIIRAFIHNEITHGLAPGMA